jgi:hypothetical protein
MPYRWWWWWRRRWWRWRGSYYGLVAVDPVKRDNALSAGERYCPITHFVVEVVLHLVLLVGHGARLGPEVPGIVGSAAKL